MRLEEIAFAFAIAISISLLARRVLAVRDVRIGLRRSGVGKRCSGLEQRSQPTSSTGNTTEVPRMFARTSS